MKRKHQPSHSTERSKTVLQPKLRPGYSPHVPGSSAGVVQAHVSGGNRALQARLNLWNVKLNAGTSPSGPTIQRKGGNGVEAFRVPLRPKAGGLPLPTDVRAKMETAFSADFSDVRVHIGHEATSLGAIAYTWGTNIHFAPGQYNPHTIQGQKLLGNEL
ncbi:MAG TPA: DUF4157 domain-containing protein, partial [Pyrinomonadaceae bacterium]|nr:DUF4157 domain-containing protein [Pyrinomonadaceae bacterium]